MEKIINIAYSSDDNFAQHLCVAAFSTLANLSPGVKARIVILDGGISSSKKERIISSLNKYSQKIASLNFINMANSDFSEFKESGWISKATYYRINLPKLCPDMDKILYLDCDLVVEKSVDELYDIDFDGSVLLAIKDPSTKMERDYSSINIPNIQGYFNAGIIVIDLKKFREERISEKIVASLKEINYLTSSHDQSAFNAVLYDKWKAVDPKWNRMTNVSIESNYKNTTYTKADFDSAKFNPSIIHYTSYFAKPWLFCSISPVKSHYYHYLNMTSFCDFKPKISLKKIFKKAFYFFAFFCLRPIVLFARRWLAKNKQTIELVLLILLADSQFFDNFGI